MKVLMTADAVGGVWTYALDLCAALSAHDVSVVLATMGPRPSEAQRAVAKSLGAVQLVESEYRLEWMDDPWADVTAAGAWLLRLASTHAVDLVHLNGYAHAALDWDRPVVCVAHSCVMTWWQAVHGTPAPPQWDVYRRNVAGGLNAADCVIAPTAAFLEQLRTCYDFSQPARVIHNARAWTARSDRPANENAEIDHAASRHQSNRCGEQGSDPASHHRRTSLVLACGRPWDISKNMAVLDAAAKGARWSAHVIGSIIGPDGQSFTPSSVRCLGALPSSDVDAWLQRANIFVHPALYEPFGLAALEAAMADCTLVLADIPTLRELWTGAAEFFDPHDSRALRTALDQLIAQPSRRQTLAAAARERASQYRIEGTATEYVDVYQSLITKRTNSKRAVA